MRCILTRHSRNVRISVKAEEVSPSSWSEAQVGNWLKSIELARYAAIFKKNHVDGEVLRVMTNELFKELVQSTGHRAKILRARDDLFAVNS